MPDFGRESLNTGRPAGRRPAGRADFKVFLARIRPESGPGTSPPARKHSLIVFLSCSAVLRWFPLACFGNYSIGFSFPYRSKNLYYKTRAPPPPPARPLPRGRPGRISPACTGEIWPGGPGGVPGGRRRGPTLQIKCVGPLGCDSLMCTATSVCP